jgi:hypothetical protein
VKTPETSGGRAPTDAQLVKALRRKGLVEVLLYRGRWLGERRWVPRDVAAEIQARGLGQIMDGR